MQGAKQQRAGTAAASVALVATLAFSLTPPGARAADWREVTSGGIQVISAVAEKDTLIIADAIQAYQSAVARVLPRAEVGPRVPVTMIVLNNSLWRKYLESKQRYAGLFYSYPDHAYILINGAAWTEAAPLVYHELTHFLLYQNMSPRSLPLWYNEGYAELLSTLELRDGEMRLGVVPIGRSQTLRSASWVPLQTLLNITAFSQQHHDKGLASMYAQSWLILHHGLFEDQTRGAQMERYRVLVANGESPQTAFRLAFPGDQGEYEQELFRYAQRKAFQYATIPFSGARTLGSSSLSTISEIAALNELARLMISNQAFGYANMLWLKKLAKSEPPQSLAALQLALARLMAGEVSSGQPALEAGCLPPIQSVRTAVVCGRGYWELVRIRLDRVSEDDLRPLDASSIPEPTRELATKARSYYEIALELEPDNLEGLLGITRTYAVALGDSTAARSGLERASRHLPHSAAIAYSLAALFQPVDLEKAQRYLERAVLNAREAAEEKRYLEYLNEIASKRAVRGAAEPAAAH